MKERRNDGKKAGRDREGIEEATEVERKDRRKDRVRERWREREMKKIPVIRLLYVCAQVMIKG